MDSMEHGVLRIVCEQPDAAREILRRAHDRWTETEVLMIGLDNRPGVFARVTQQLADAHVNISYAYLTGGAGDGRTNAVFKVADMKKAHKILSDDAGRSRAQAKDKRAARTVKKAPPGRT